MTHLLIANGPSQPITQCHPSTQSSWCIVHDIRLGLLMPAWLILLIISSFDFWLIINTILWIRFIFDRRPHTCQVWTLYSIISILIILKNEKNNEIEVIDAIILMTLNILYYVSSERSQAVREVQWHKHHWLRPSSHDLRQYNPGAPFY